MKLVTLRILLAMTLSAFFTTGFAGGRYEDPPTFLIEVYNLTQQTAEAIKQGDQTAALEAANKGRKLAYDSSKEKSTMPMQIANSNLKKAIRALKNNNLADASSNVDKVLNKLTVEIDYYKNEGKL
ncbi:MAG: hypothetical protein ACU84J_15090 [Gammaproteobacteria bacterium]